MASGSPIKQKGFKRLVEPISEILTETVDSVATATTQGKIAPSGTHLSSESQGVNLGGTRSTVRSSEVTVEGTQLTTSTNHLDANNPSKTAAGDASSGTNDPLSGDPISMVTGEERLTLVDGVLPGLMPFTFQRTYASSAVETLNGLGFGWSHSLSHRLLFKDGQVEWHDHENIIITFPEPLNGKATITNQMSGAEIALTASDGIYQLTQSRGQGIYRFQRQGNEARLIAITNQYGQDITVKYDTFRRLSCVIQQGAARYHFDYHADFPELITQVVPSVYRGVDFSDTEGWQVLPAIMTYHYNDKQQLIRTVSGSGEQELYDYREDHVLIRRELAGLGWGEYRQRGALRQQGAVADGLPVCAVHGAVLRGMAHLAPAGPCLSRSASASSAPRAPARRRWPRNWRHAWRRTPACAWPGCPSCCASGATALAARRRPTSRRRSCTSSTNASRPRRPCTMWWCATRRR